MIKHVDFEVPGFGEFASPPAPRLAYSQAVLAMGPAAYWRLGEASGATAYDEVGGHHGAYSSGDVLLGQPGAIARDPDTAVRITGYGAPVDMGNVLDMGASDFSISAWVNADSDVRQAILGKNYYFYGTYSVPGFGLGINLNKWAFQVRDAAGGHNALTGPAVTAGAWTHLVGVRAGAQRRLYVNGVLAASDAYGAVDTSNGEPFILGSSSSSRVFDGLMDEVAVFGRALSDGEAAELYRRGSAPLLVADADARVGAALSQSADAAMPGRGSVGLRVSLTGAGGGACVEHALPVAVSALRSRLMLGPADAQGGRVALMGGQDADGNAAWWLSYDADAAVIAASSAGSTATLLADVPAFPWWRQMEIGIDARGGATLWVNGRVADHLDAGFDAPATASLWLGAMDKSPRLAGTLRLDEWAIDAAADTPIGPARVDPTSPYADDPARWLVVCNAASPDSLAWARHYQAVRSIPHANVLALDLPLDETISESRYQSMRAAIETYLDDTHLRDQVVGIVLGCRVPGFVADVNGLGPSSIGNLLQPADPDDPDIDNPLALDAAPTRPTAGAILDAGMRIVAQVDGPTLADSVALVDRATGLIADPLAADAGSAFYLDAFPTPSADADPVAARWFAYARSLERQRTRLPFVAAGDINATDTSVGRHDFASVRGEALSVAWSDATPPAGYFADPAGRRALAVSLFVNASANTTLRDPDADQWAAAALRAGYAAAIVSSRITTLSNSPYPRPMLEALRAGWTLGEAWLLAQPIRVSGFFLVGDPLMRLTMPRSGVDVIGPLDRLDAVTPDAPLAALLITARSFDVPEAARIAAGGAGLFTVSVFDESGRPERSYPVAAVVVDDAGAPSPAPLPPLWPDHPGWAVSVRGGALALSAWWGRALRHTNLTAVNLDAAALSDGVVTTAAQPALDPAASRVAVTLPLPDAPVRYRWSTRADGPWVAGPWSSPTPVALAADTALTAV